MASRLSSLLVRDGLVGVKRMERAFQRQVIYGGSLDTILLEMSLIDEATLCEYLSLATGLPAATAEQLEMISSEATEACPEELAREFYVAPLTIENDALRVLVSEPVDFTQLEDLADRLDMAIQPLVAPEFRFNLLFSRAFGHPANARFTKLAEAVTSIEPVTRPKPPEPAPASAPGANFVDAGWTLSAMSSRIPALETTEPMASAPVEPEPEPEPAVETLIAENEIDHQVVDVPLPPTTAAPRATLRMGSDRIQERHAETLAPPFGASKPKRVSDAYRIVRPLREADEPGDNDEPRPRTSTIHAWTPPTPDEGGEIREVVEPDLEETVPVASAPEPPEASPLSVAEARELLATAGDRDAIFEIFLRALSSRTRFAALMINQGGTGLGRFALDGGARSSAAIESAAIPLESPSPFRQVLDSASPYIGRLASGNPEIDAQAQRLCGGELPPSALLLPIVLRDRVVAVAVAHRAPENIEITELAEILPLARQVAEALVRLIRDAKKRAATMTRDLEAGAAEAPAAAATPAATRNPDVDRLLDQVESTDRDASEEAMRQLLGRGDEVVPLLDERFPGRLEVDRYEIGWRTIRASQYGPILDLIIRLGVVCGPMLASKLGDPRRDVRYYAAMCAAELRPHATLEALVDRIFDRDYGVRDIALHALAGYPAAELDQALSVVRSALHSDLAERVIAAANAVAVLADLRSIPHLLEVLEGERETAIPARRALRRLTCQDFAWSIRKWRSWWDENRGRSRIEWLLDSLGHRDEEIRRQAVDDLRTLTGESFDYNHDGTRREREDSRARWLQWWETEGATRFAAERRDDDPPARFRELDR